METKKEMRVSIPLEESVEARIDQGVLVLKGAKGETKRSVNIPPMHFDVKDKQVIITSTKTTKREKKIANTFRSHIKNMIKGASEGHTYTLKICSGHFPMNVSVNKNQLIIKNFIGEKHPRTLNIKEGVDVKVDGDKIIVESVNKELAGTTASDIERLTRRANFDMRIFQDGIYIINKDGKEIK